MNPTRSLVIMRHAKAESFGESDALRALTERGVLDAAAAGEWLGGQEFTPDHALVSAAVRTRQTWEAMARAAGWTLEPDLEPAMYAAGPESALDLLRRIPAEARQVLIVGHNPTVSHLALMLANGTGSDTAARAMAQGHPTSAVAVFGVAGEWRGLSYGDATLNAFHVGRAG